MVRRKGKRALLAESLASLICFKALPPRHSNVISYEPKRSSHMHVASVKRQMLPAVSGPPQSCAVFTGDKVSRPSVTLQFTIENCVCACTKTTLPQVSCIYVNKKVRLLALKTISTFFAWPIWDTIVKLRTGLPSSHITASVLPWKWKSSSQSGNHS